MRWLAVAALAAAQQSHLTRDSDARTPLMHAAYRGDAEFVQDYLNRATSVQDYEYIDLVDSYGDSAIMIASYRGQIDAVKVLKRAGASTAITNHAGQTAVMLASLRRGDAGTTEAARIRDENRDIIEVLRSDPNLPPALGGTAEELLSAVQYGNIWDSNTSWEIATVDWLLENGAPPDATDPEGRTALMHAAWKGDPGSVHALIAAGAPLDTTDPTYGQTALMWAAKRGPAANVQALVDAGAHTGIVDWYGQTAFTIARARGADRVVQALRSRPPLQSVYAQELLRATKRGEVARVQELIQLGAPLDAVDEDGQTALMYASYNGNDGQVAPLLAEGAGVHFQDDEGRTALHFAARRGHAGTAAQLLAAGHPVDIRDVYGDTALLIAAKFEHIDTVRALVNAGADPYVQNRYTQTPVLLARINQRPDIVEALVGAAAMTTNIITAAKRNEVNAVRFLIQAGTNVDRRDEDGMTALMWASWRGYIEICRLLIDANAAVDPVAHNGWTATILANSNGRDDIIEVLDSRQKTATEAGLELIAATARKDVPAMQQLLAEGAPVDAQDADGQTPLMRAAFTGANTDLLLDAGATVSARDNDGRTALLHAASSGNTATMHMLLDAGADINAVDLYGDSAVHLAAMGEHMASIQALVHAGATTGRKNARGQTAEMIAGLRGRWDMMKVLNPGYECIPAAEAYVPPETRRWTAFNKSWGWDTIPEERSRLDRIC